MRTRNHYSIARDFTNWTDAMNRTYGHPGHPYDYARNGGNDGQENGERRMRLPLDVLATEDSFQILAYLPGVDPENVEITVEGDELSIRGELPQVEEDTHYVRRELFHGTFERRLNFNVAVNVDAIEANFKNGLLTLTVPKAEEIRPKHIKVQTV